MGFLCPHGSRYPPTKLLTCFSPKQKSAKRPPNLPGPFAGLLFCTSVGVLNYGSSTVEMSMKIGERLLDLSLRDAQATTEKETLVMPKRWVIRFVCLFVGHQGWMLSVFFWGGRGLIYDFELFVCRVWSGVVICDRALGSHQSQGLKPLSIMEMGVTFIASQ